jgi:outer membrane murein-binding lipoprotein Lpp
MCCEKEEAMRLMAASALAVALVILVAGCPGGQKVSDLEAQVQDAQQKIAELEGMVQTLTMERDSLQKLVDEKMGGGKPPKTGREPGKQITPSKKTGTPGKPPRTGR